MEKCKHISTQFAVVMYLSVRSSGFAEENQLIRTKESSSMNGNEKIDK